MLTIDLVVIYAERNFYGFSAFRPNFDVPYDNTAYGLREPPSASKVLNPSYGSDHTYVPRVVSAESCFSHVLKRKALHNGVGHKGTNRAYWLGALLHMLAASYSYALEEFRAQQNQAVSKDWNRWHRERLLEDLIEERHGMQAS